MYSVQNNCPALRRDEKSRENLNQCVCFDENVSSNKQWKNTEYSYVLLQNSYVHYYPINVI